MPVIGISWQHLFLLLTLMFFMITLNSDEIMMPIRMSLTPLWKLCFWSCHLYVVGPLVHISLSFQQSFLRWPCLSCLLHIQTNLDFEFTVPAGNPILDLLFFEHFSFLYFFFPWRKYFSLNMHLARETTFLLSLDFFLLFLPFFTSFNC